MKKKKVIILVIFLLAILLLIVAFTRKDAKQEVSSINDIELNITDEVLESEIENLDKEIEQEEIEKNTFQTDESEQEEVQTNTEIVQNKPSSSNVEMKAMTQEQEKIETQPQSSNSNTASVAKVEEQTKEETEVQVQTTSVQEPVTQEQQTREFTFKQNDAYIQKIKDYLKNNESEYMKKYGYTIVIDSSIVDKTTGFTYSELNMSGYTNTAGTIKIYARDYFVNGTYLETRCYVL